MLYHADRLAANICATSGAYWARGELTSRFNPDSRGPLPNLAKWPTYRLSPDVSVSTDEPVPRTGIYLPTIDDSCVQFLIEGDPADQTGSRRHFRQGEMFPRIENSDYGETFWLWASDQSTIDARRWDPLGEAPDGVAPDPRARVAITGSSDRPDHRDASRTGAAGSGSRTWYWQPDMSAVVFAGSPSSGRLRSRRRLPRRTAAEEPCSAARRVHPASGDLRSARRPLRVVPGCSTSAWSAGRPSRPKRADVPPCASPPTPSRVPPAALMQNGRQARACPQGLKHRHPEPRPPGPRLPRQRPSIE